MLTDPELEDPELLPHDTKPNPHRSTFAKMMLYVRFQVEEFAFQKWGSPESLDAEFYRREDLKRQKKDKKFELKLRDLRNRTRTSTWSKASMQNRKHEHTFGDTFVDSSGVTLARCSECGLETEQLVL